MTSTCMYPCTLGILHLWLDYDYFILLLLLLLLFIRTVYSVLIQFCKLIFDCFLVHQCCAVELKLARTGNLADLIWFADMWNAYLSAVWTLCRYLYHIFFRFINPKCFYLFSSISLCGVLYIVAVNVYPHCLSFQFKKDKKSLSVLSITWQAVWLLY